MSLYQLSDGILETHVTWEDVEHQLQKTLDTKATFGNNRKATNISDMKGFMSRIALVEPDWQNVEEGEQLPEKFIVKIASQLALANLNLVMKNSDFNEEKLQALSQVTREVHNREVHVYSLLQKFNHPNIPYTKIYGLKLFESETDPKGYVIADFVANAHSVPIFEPIPADDLKAIVIGLATFAALAETVNPEEKSFAGGEEYMEMVYREFFNEETMRNNFETLKTTLGPENEEDADKLIDIYWHYFHLLPKYSHISKHLGFHRVLNHGDLHTGNMLHSMGEDGKLKLEAMIDWQACVNVSPGVDMARIIVACLPIEDIRNKVPELLKLYYETFTSTLGKELFSLQELIDSYSLYFPTMAMMMQPGIIGFIDASDLSEDEKVKTKEKAMGKVIGLMEDMFKVHEKNLNTFPDFMKL